MLPGCRLSSLANVLIIVLVCGGIVMTFARPSSYCDLDPADKRNFHTLLDDDFINQALDRTVWNAISDNNAELYNDDRCGDSLCQVGNVMIDNNHSGYLVLRSRLGTRHVSPDKVYHHTSSAVTTQDKLVMYPSQHTITRICIRAKLPMGEKTTKDGEMIDTASGLMPLFQLTANNARRLDIPESVSPSTTPNDKDNILHNNTSQFNYPYHNFSRDYNPTPDPPTYFSCNPDEGQVTIMKHIASSSVITTEFQWQTNTPEHICQFPKNNQIVTHNTTLEVENINNNPDGDNNNNNDGDDENDPDAGFHEFAIERSGDQIVYIYDGIPRLVWSTDPEKQHKNPSNFPTPDPHPISINQTSPFFLSLSVVFGSDIAGPIYDEYIPDDGWKIVIDYVKISHYDSKEPQPERQRRIQIMLMIILAVAVSLFLTLIFCCSFCRKKQDYQHVRVHSGRLTGEFTESLTTPDHPLLTN